ncbi:type II toxin-antitoxin system VapC family toxin [Janibacter anophelis]|uniref:type II toxin-antitoxin system VapC family toxin n=1 Tax=Janibacter anophelis TaxID=319054 RepID=UPI00082CC495|nr:type II toxin-antitoxin system VapC family toxin [Janibacter anophelis]
MIVDTSALVAVLRGEHDADRFIAAMESAPDLRVSTATVLECTLVLGPRRTELLDELLQVVAAEIVPFDEEQLALAREAHRRYGRGSGSAARLNFGDCFTYALAHSRGEPLLFKGDDFTRTDVTAT